MITNGSGIQQKEVWRKGSWDERELLIGDVDEDGEITGIQNNYGHPTPGENQDRDFGYIEIDPINQKVVKRLGNTFGPSGIGLNSSRLSSSSFNNPFKLARPPSQNI